MKLGEMLNNCFSNIPDQIAWRMSTDNGDYEIVNFPEYMTRFIPGGVVYLTDYEVKDWNFDIRNCRLYVDLCEEEKSYSAVEDTQEDFEEEEDKDNWVIKVKLSNEAGSTTFTKTYMNTASKRVVDYYNQMINQINIGCVFVKFPDDHDCEQDVAMASSQIVYIIIKKSKE